MCPPRDSQSCETNCSDFCTKNKKTKYDVAVSDILYIDTLDRHITVHLNDKTSIVTREPLNSYLVQKAFSGFIQISSSCIVNHVHIYSNFNLKTI